jgi:hypothetical protein
MHELPEKIDTVLSLLEVHCYVTLSLSLQVPMSMRKHKRKFSLPLIVRLE